MHHDYHHLCFSSHFHSSSSVLILHPFRKKIPGLGETDGSPWTIPHSDISPAPCSVKVRVKEWVGRVGVRVRSVGLGLGRVGLVLVLGLELGLWFGLEGEISGREMSDTQNSWR